MELLKNLPDTKLTTKLDQDIFEDLMRELKGGLEENSVRWRPRITEIVAKTVRVSIVEGLKLMGQKIERHLGKVDQSAR